MVVARPTPRISQPIRFRGCRVAISAPTTHQLVTTAV